MTDAFGKCVNTREQLEKKRKKTASRLVKWTRGRKPSVTSLNITVYGFNPICTESRGKVFMVFLAQRLTLQVPIVGYYWGKSPLASGEIISEKMHTGLISQFRCTSKIWWSRVMWLWFAFVSVSLSKALILKPPASPVWCP